MEVEMATVAIIAINVIIFLIETAGRDTIDAKFAMYAPAVQQGQWYRLITACFLHANIMHIACNMWSLWNLGLIAGEYIGPVEYILVYFGAGICGNLLTYVADSAMHRYPISLGASGAIFGIVGLLIALAITHRADLNARGLVLNAIYMLLPGLFGRGISNTAHIGGLSGGFVITYILSIAQNLLE